jgi:hypothetical protein
MDNISFTAAGSVARFAAMAEYMAEVHEDAGNLATARQLDRLAGFARDRASADKAKFPCETALPEELREVAAMVVETRGCWRGIVMDVDMHDPDIQRAIRPGKHSWARPDKPSARQYRDTTPPPRETDRYYMPRR